MLLDSSRNAAILALAALEEEREKIANIAAIGRGLGGLASKAKGLAGDAAIALRAPKPLSEAGRAAMIAEPMLPAAAAARGAQRNAARAAFRGAGKNPAIAQPVASQAAVSSQPLRKPIPRAGETAGTAVARPPSPPPRAGTELGTPLSAQDQLAKTTLRPAAESMVAARPGSATAVSRAPTTVAQAPARSRLGLPGPVGLGLLAGVPAGVMASGGEKQASVSRQVALEQLGAEKLALLGQALQAAKAGGGTLLRGARAAGTALASNPSVQAGQSIARRFGGGLLVGGGLTAAGIHGARGLAKGTDAQFTNVPYGGAPVDHPTAPPSQLENYR